MRTHLDSKQAAWSSFTGACGAVSAALSGEMKLCCCFFLLLSLLTTANTSVLSGRFSHRKGLLWKEHDIDDASMETSAISDPEALLGKADAKAFETLQPKEKRQKLSELVTEKIDGDHDGFVTPRELTQWIALVRKRTLQEESKQHWNKLNVTESGLTWLGYKEAIYGKQQDVANDSGSVPTTIAQDSRRFKAADVDGSDALSFDEFVNFHHPEEAAHMRPTVMLDAMEDLDSNRDGFVDEEEYIGAFWEPAHDERAEPEWVSRERLFFHKLRDLDHDGRLSDVEVQRWVAPLDRDTASLESEHLVRNSDLDRDGRLTIVEILHKFELFVQSEATNYGSDLVGRHDEL